MKNLLISGLFLLATSGIYAQDFAFAKPTPEEFEMTRYDKDTSANAVVLREFGTAFISSVDYKLVYDYHVRVKIFNAKGFGQGNVSIPVRKNDANTFETISDIKGVTFYRDEQNLLRTADLEEKQIFREKGVSKYHDLTKFALPHLSDGCIIEYSYQIQSPFLFNFRTWQFQSEIPKIYSEFQPRIPGCYNYNVSIKGPYKLSKNTGEVEKECFTPGGGFKSDCSRMTYGMADIPAFKEEDYMTAPSNFMSAIFFELSEYTNPHGTKVKVTKEWKDIDHELKTDESFGLQLKRGSNYFKDLASSLTAGKTSELDKAKSIYKHFQKWYKWNKYYGKYSIRGIKKSYEEHSGEVGDINLGLVAAMSAADIDAEPVILSTRQNGIVNNLYPVLSDFDYVVCKINIGETSYMLDATDPLLPFGLLPIRCINDKGRVISQTKPSYWIDLKASQKELKTINLTLDVQEDGKAKGTVAIYSLGYEAYNKRKKIKEFNSYEAYVEDLDERMPKIKLTRWEENNLDSLDATLAEIYEVEMSLVDPQMGAGFSLNPFFMERITENPFKLLERTYPVDMGAPSETRIVMQINYPESFEVENLPANTGLALPASGGKFITQCNKGSNSVQFLNNLTLSKSVYSPSEYLYLKELYNKIIQTQQSNILFKKKI